MTRYSQARPAQKYLKPFKTSLTRLGDQQTCLGWFKLFFQVRTGQSLVLIFSRTTKHKALTENEHQFHTVTTMPNSNIQNQKPRTPSVKMHLK